MSLTKNATLAHIHTIAKKKPQVLALLNKYGFPLYASATDAQVDEKVRKAMKNSGFKMAYASLATGVSASNRSSYEGTINVNQGSVKMSADGSGDATVSSAQLTDNSTQPEANNTVNINTADYASTPVATDTISTSDVALKGAADAIADTLANQSPSDKVVTQAAISTVSGQGKVASVTAWAKANPMLALLLAVAIGFAAWYAYKKYIRKSA